MSAVETAPVVGFPHDVLAAPGGATETAEDDLALLMVRHERSLYTFMLTLLRDHDTALDCTQDTFVRAYEHLDQGKTVNRNWLYTVARNRAMDEFRRRRRVQPELDALEQVPVVHESIEGTIDVQHVMERLPEPDRELLYLFEIAGFKTDEIGAMLGVRGSAIRQRLYRARERFRLLYHGKG